MAFNYFPLKLQRVPLSWSPSLSTSFYQQELYRYTNIGTTLLWHESIQGCLTETLVTHRPEAVSHGLSRYYLNHYYQLSSSSIFVCIIFYRKTKVEYTWKSRAHLKTSCGTPKSSQYSWFLAQNPSAHWGFWHRKTGILGLRNHIYKICLPFYTLFQVLVQCLLPMRILEA